MFLFSGSPLKSTNISVNLLHTGDFRFKPSMLEHFKLPGDGTSYLEIDYLYLDNTFATHAEGFPPQEEAFEQLFKIISQKKEHHENENFGVSKAKEIKFNLYCYTLGKEEIFHSLARNFDTKVRCIHYIANR